MATAVSLTMVVTWLILWVVISPGIRPLLGGLKFALPDYATGFAIGTQIPPRLIRAWLRVPHKIADQVVAICPSFAATQAMAKRSIARSVAMKKNEQGIFFESDRFVRNFVVLIASGVLGVPGLASVP